MAELTLHRHLLRGHLLRGLLRGAAFVLVIASVGCAHHFRAEIVGRASATAGGPGRVFGPASVAPVTADVEIEERPAAHVLRYTVSTPRAVRLRYVVA